MEIFWRLDGMCRSLMLISLPDYYIYLLWGHAEQVGSADLPPRLHKESAGLPSGTSSSRLAILHLHVHACWVGRTNVTCLRLIV